MRSFTCWLTMESDWHVGTGAGGGAIDRVVARDADGLPFVPAKTLTGIWRDGCERLAFALDHGGHGGWTDFVDQMFGSQPGLRGNGSATAGSPTPAVLSVRPARIPEPLRGLLAAGGPQGLALRRALSFVKPGVSIDRDHGWARDEFLRFEEVARRGAVLTAAASLDCPEPLETAMLSFLVAGAALVERIGGKRRRGNGQCRLRLDCRVDLSGAVAWLRVHDVPPVAAAASTQPLQLVAPVTDGGWQEIALELRLDAPVVVPSQVVGNVVESLDYIPGHFLLPLITRVGRRLGVDLSQAIADAGLVVLPAYIELDHQRARPAPFALATTKDAGLDLPALVPMDNRSADLRPVKDGWVEGGGASVHLHKVPRMTRTHNAIEDAEQRPNEDVGGVYTYQAIAAPNRFRSALRLRTVLHDELNARHKDWWKLLEGPHRLGRSSKDDYGDVHLTSGEPAVPRAAGALRELVAGDELTVWCQSDVLLVDAGLRQHVASEALCSEIQAALPDGVRLTAVHGSARLRVHRLESWQRQWQLPRPSLLAVAAGSCLTIRIDHGKVTAEELGRLCTEGVGQRRAEGHGQVIVLDPLLQAAVASDASTPDGADAGGVSVNPTGDDARAGKDDPVTPILLPRPADHGDRDPIYTSACQIENAAWREAIRQRAVALAADSTQREEHFGWPVAGGLPPTSQLNAFRSAVQRLTAYERDNWAASWLARLSEVKARREKWPGSCIEKATKLVQDRDAVWDALGPPADWPRLTEDGPERLRNDLWSEALIALVSEAVRQHLRGREEPREVAHGT